MIEQEIAKIKQLALETFGPVEASKIKQFAVEIRSRMANYAFTACIDSAIRLEVEAILMQEEKDSEGK